MNAARKLQIEQVLIDIEGGDWTAAFETAPRIFQELLDEYDTIIVHEISHCPQCRGSVFEHWTFCNGCGNKLPHMGSGITNPNMPRPTQEIPK